MAQQWEGLLEGAAQELRGHLTLERVTASKAGDEISVFFSSDMLVEERPFLAAQRAMRRNFAPTRVKLIIRSPQRAQAFRSDPQKYAPFILRCVKRRHPSGAPFMNDATLECKGDVLSVLVPQDIAPKFLAQSGVDKYIEQLVENVFVTQVHVVFQAVKLREEQLEEIRRRRKAEDEQAVAAMIKTQSEQVAAQEVKAVKEKPKAIFGRPITAEPLPISELTEEASKLTICGEVLTVETRELRGGEMQLLSFALTDYTNTIKCKTFLRYKPRKGRFGNAQEDDDRPPTEEEKKAAEEKSEKSKQTLDFVKKTLGDKVKDVRLSDNLGSHPVSVVPAEGMTFEMEKYFKRVDPNSGMKADRILEFNADHPIFAKLQIAVAQDEKKAEDLVKILYTQALLMADLPVENAGEYTDLVCSLIG